MIGPERLLLVTDSSRALDLPPGLYKFGHHVTGTDFDHDGRVGRVPGGSLASSAMGLDHMVRVMKARTSAPLCEVIRTASLTPAERTGLASDVGSLTPGKRADVLLLNPTLRVKHVWLAGIPVRP